MTAFLPPGPALVRLLRPTHAQAFLRSCVLSDLHFRRRSFAGTWYFIVRRQQLASLFSYAARFGVTTPETLALGVLRGRNVPLVICDFICRPHKRRLHSPPAARSGDARRAVYAPFPAESESGSRALMPAPDFGDALTAMYRGQIPGLAGSQKLPGVTSPGRPALLSRVLPVVTLRRNSGREHGGNAAHAAEYINLSFLCFKSSAPQG